ncbi:MAG: hypothetical protein JW846_06435 [Dehalococcoidia bacterium]|nr:hypothetical protein [Dehalococcoidia bacterium]
MFQCTVVVLLILLACAGCSAPAEEGFAIYLTRSDVPPAQMPALSHVEIAANSVISTADIVAYHADTHEIDLTTDAYNRICSLQVPVNGRSFMVCVNGQPMYWGAFWAPISSLSFTGVTILKPLGSHDLNTIRLDLGYPSDSFFEGEDPRDNADVLESLERAGRLAIRSPATGYVVVPQALKGYELYSWVEGDQWHFTLITGTNRNKSIDEVTATSIGVREDGFVQLHIVGIEALNSVLGSLPTGESIAWFAALQWDEASADYPDIELPPPSLVDAVKAHAEARGLILYVQE